MQESKKILKSLSKVFKKPQTLLSNIEYNQFVKEYFYGNFKYSIKNAKTLFNIMFKLNNDFRYFNLTPSEKFVAVEKKRFNDPLNGSYNQYFKKITLYKHSYKNKLYDLSFDFVTNLHETKHAHHHFTTMFNLNNGIQFKNEIEKMLSTCWTNKVDDYVNFEELITRMQTFIEYFDLIQKEIGKNPNDKNPIPLTRETLFVIYETVIDCYSYKYAIIYGQENETINSFSSYEDFIPPKFDVNFCVGHFEQVYMNIASKLSNSQLVNFKKLKEELTVFASEFDKKAQQYLSLVEDILPCSLSKKPFKPTQNVANSIQILKENYSHLKYIENDNQQEKE